MEDAAAYSDSVRRGIGVSAYGSGDPQRHAAPLQVMAYHVLDVLHSFFMTHQTKVYTSGCPALVHNLSRCRVISRQDKETKGS
ncbi:MAG: hypothetical protein R3C44_17500 [Chloroflexota bacterium]